MEPVVRDPGRRASWLRRLSLIGAVAAICCVAYWLGSVVSRPGGPNEGLVVKQEFLDFGEVWETKSFAWSLPVDNPTGKTVSIHDVLSTCNCLSIKPKSLDIPSRETATLKLTIDLTARNPGEEGQLLRQFTVRVVPQIQNSTSYPSGWVVTGKVRTAVTLTPKALHYGETLLCRQPFPQQKAVVTVHPPVTSIVASCAPAMADVRVSKVVNASNQYEIAIAPKSTLPIGRFKFAVVVTPVTPNEVKIPDLLLPVEGRVSEEVQAIPESVCFSAGLQGQQVEEIVVLRALVGNKFTVESIDGLSSHLRVECGAAMTPAVSHTCRLVKGIRQAGNDRDTLVFHLKTEHGIRIQLPLELTSYGISNNTADRKE